MTMTFKRREDGKLLFAETAFVIFDVSTAVVPTTNSVPVSKLTPTFATITKEVVFSHSTVVAETGVAPTIISEAASNTVPGSTLIINEVAAPVKAE